MASLTTSMTNKVNLARATCRALSCLFIKQEKIAIKSESRSARFSKNIMANNGEKMKKLLSLTLTFFLTFAMLLSVGCSTPKGGVNVKYYGTAQDIVPLMLAGKETIGLIPEPAATNLEKVMQKQGKEIYRLDLQELYESETKAYPQAVLMVKKNVLTEELYNQLKSSIEESIGWVNDNVEIAVSAIGSKFATTLDASKLTPSAIKGCKIYFENSNEAKESVNKYIGDIRSIDQASANEVDDDFFFNKEETVETINQESLTFCCPDGAPALAVSKLINDNNDLGTGKAIEYKVVAPKMLAGDIVVMPLNLATKKYKANASDAYVCVAVLTHGNFYIMSTDKITVDDLRDRQIAVPNMGAVPDWTIRKVLLNKGYTINVVE